MIIDIVAALVVVSSALISFMRGFIREVLTIAGVIGGVVAAILLGPVFVPMVRGWFGVVEDAEKPAKLFDIIPMEIVSDAVTYGVIFLTVVIVLSVLSHMMSGAAKAMGLGPVDRTLGVFFGIARGLLLLGLVYLPFHLLMGEKQKEDIFKDSQTHYFIEKVSTVMAQYLPESEDVEKKIDDTTGDLIKQKLEDQNLLGTPTKKEAAPPPDEKIEKSNGYKQDERQKMDSLFVEPVEVNE